ncbi:MAG: DUF2325 domain-containing protein [Planctomycetota bacterium]
MTPDPDRPPPAPDENPPGPPAGPGGLAGLLVGLRQALRESAALRRLAGLLAGFLHDALAEVEVAPSEPPAAVEPPPAPPPARPMELALGTARAVVEVSGPARVAPAPAARAPRAVEGEVVGPHWTRGPEVNETRLVRRARLKAECCRWAGQRRRRLQEGAEFDAAVKPHDEELGRRARELETFAWPLDPYAALPADEGLEDLASCYDNVAAALELAREIRADEEMGGAFLPEAFQLLAEAQSALRFGLRPLTGQKEDDVQEGAFLWLRRRTAWDEIYVPRHMKLDDPADPRRWHGRQEEIDALRGRWEAESQTARRRKNLLGKVRYHARRVEQGGSASDPREEWKKIDEAVAGLLSDGLPVSNVELRDLLRPVIELVPDGVALSADAERVLEEIDRFLASREAEAGLAPRPREPSPEVRQASELLRGRTVVLIGGHERPQSRDALVKSLGLAELRWITATSGTSFGSFEPQIARPETALVLLAIRWSSHSFENVKGLCQKHGKPFVRLPGGYSPNQVARQVLDQASGRLGG